MLMDGPGIIHYPAVARIGPFVVNGYSFALALAFVVGWYAIMREDMRRGGNGRIADLIFLTAVIGTLLGSKIYYAIVSGDLDSLASRGGHSFWGGVLGASGACWMVARWRRISFLRMADVAAIAIAAGYAVGRTGCWAVGDDYGRAWSSPLAVRFPYGEPPSTAANMMQFFGESPPPGSAPWSVIAVHPTQLYETVLGLVMFAILWRQRDHPRAVGWLFGLYGVLAGAERFMIEFFRAKPDRLGVGLSVAQLVAIAIAIGGALLMYARRRVTQVAPGIYAKQ